MDQWIGFDLYPNPIRKKSSLSESDPHPNFRVWNVSNPGLDRITCGLHSDRIADCLQIAWRIGFADRIADRIAEHIVDRIVVQITWT